MKLEQTNAEFDTAIKLINEVKDKLSDENDKACLNSALHSIEKILIANDSLLLLNVSPKIYNMIFKSGITTYSMFKAMDESQILAIPRLNDAEKETILIEHAKAIMK